MASRKEDKKERKQKKEKKPAAEGDGTTTLVVSIDDFTRTRDSVIVGLAALQSAVSDLSRAYINHANTVLNRGPSSIDIGGLNSLLENGIFPSSVAAGGVAGAAAAAPAPVIETPTPATKKSSPEKKEKKSKSKDKDRRASAANNVAAEVASPVPEPPKSEKKARKKRKSAVDE